MRQQCLYFFPLPQGQESLRPGFIWLFQVLLAWISFVYLCSAIIMSEYCLLQKAATLVLNEK